MSVRASGYDRIPADLYETPDFVIAALGEFVEFAGAVIWEPACGTGKMVRALEARGATVLASDLIEQGFEGLDFTMDFTDPDASATPYFFQDIITNPPYGPQGKTAEKFIERALDRLPVGGMLALLLQVDFDSGKTRRRFFKDSPYFTAKIVLTRRIAWFEPPLPKPGEKKPSGPSANHAWYIWCRHRITCGQMPVTLYAPSRVEEAA